MHPARLLPVAAALAIVVACATSDPAADTKTCPPYATTCASECHAWTVAYYDPTRGCNGYGIVGCQVPPDPDGDLDVDCGVRPDGLLVFASHEQIGNAGYPACSEAQQTANTTAKRCQ